MSTEIDKAIAELRAAADDPSNRLKHMQVDLVERKVGQSKTVRQPTPDVSIPPKKDRAMWYVLSLTLVILGVELWQSHGLALMASLSD